MGLHTKSWYDRITTSKRAEHKRHQHKAGWLPWGVAAACAVLVLIAWWGPLVGALGDWLSGNDNAPSSGQTADGTTPGSVTVSSTPGGGSGSTATVPLSKSSGGSGGTSTSGGSTSGSSGGGSTQSTGGGSTTTGGGSTTSNTGLNLRDLYNSIATGQTEQQLESLAGRTPNSCSTTQIPLLGTQQVCTWSDDSGTVVATLINNQTVAKQSIGL